MSGARSPGAWPAAVVAIASLTGCTVGPNFTRPEPAATHGFPDRSLGQTNPQDVQQASSTAAQVTDDWWTLLASPKLDQLVREALARNWTLASREAAIQRAGQELAAVRGENYPQLGAHAQVGQTRIGATVFGVDAYTFPIFSTYGAFLSADYDVDLFGGRRRRVEEAAAGLQAQARERDATALTLITNVALQAIDVAASAREIAVTEDIVASDQQTLKLVNQGHAQGAAPNTDVQDASAELDRDLARLPALRQRLQAAQNALATLAGRSPADFSAPDFQLSDFALPAVLPNLVPSAVARQRPDILAAEARLHTASAAIGVATADLYPRVDLSAELSGQGLLSGPSEVAWTLLGGIAAPIFTGGRLQANKHAAEADYRSSFADYQQVVVTALGEVADALDALANDADALRSEENARASAARSLELDRQGYAAGSADLTRVLQAQRLLDEAELGVEEARSARLADTVRLFAALGIHPPFSIDVGGGVAAPVGAPATATRAGRRSG
ncbi:MAG TPA: efflux transporter outer membrane subunit [Caulobacteraceae bacterium]|nr:efflux transporter outer membrane subunit [Caulobacteraceae bacterium]